MWICSKCQYRNSDEVAQFCGQCGSPRKTLPQTISSGKSSRVTIWQSIIIVGIAIAFYFGWMFYSGILSIPTIRHQSDNYTSMQNQPANNTPQSHVESQRGYADNYFHDVAIVLSKEIEEEKKEKIVLITISIVIAVLFIIGIIHKYHNQRIRSVSGNSK